VTSTSRGETLGPEFESVEALAEFLFDDERSDFTFAEVATLSRSLKVSISKLIPELEKYGLTYTERGKAVEVRGFTAKSDRWTACPSHGGSGYEQISGFAGNAAR
jgi:hypothetical protein